MVREMSLCDNADALRENLCPQMVFGDVGGGLSIVLYDNALPFLHWKRDGMDEVFLEMSEDNEYEFCVTFGEN